MDDGHVGAEFLRENEEYEYGSDDNVMFGSKKEKTYFILEHCITPFLIQLFPEYWCRDSPTWCPKPFWTIVVVYMERW